MFLFPSGDNTKLKKLLLGAQISAFAKDWIFSKIDSGELPRVLSWFMAHGLASDSESAVKAIVEMFEDFRKESVDLNADDFKNGRAKEKTLTEVLGFETVADKKEWKPGSISFAKFGTIGHRIIPPFLKGEEFWPEICFASNGKRKQLSLFNGHSQLEIFKTRKTGRNPSVSDVEKLWEEMVVIFNFYDGSWLKQYIALFPYAEKMTEFLYPFFGKETLGVIDRSSAYSFYFSILTLMTWASVLVYVSKGNSFNPFFSEIPVINSEHKFLRQRIDALEFSPFLDSEGRCVFSSSAFSEIVKFFQRKRKNGSVSVGKLLFALSRVYGSDACKRFIIKDFKFAVGDGVDPMSPVLDYRDSLPLSKHREQVEFYITMATLDWHLCSMNFGGSRKKISEVWRNGLGVRKGVLVYFFPNVFPVVYNISVSLKKQEEIFKEKVAAAWNEAENSARERFFAKHLVQGIKTAVQNSGNDNGLFLGAKKGRKQFQMRPKKVSTVKDVAEQFLPFIQKRMVVDRFGLIADTGKKRKDGSPLLSLSVRSLFELIENGAVAAGKSFNWFRGGAICCVLHEENEPSLHVALPGSGRKSGFYCFGCKKGGILDFSNLPEPLSYIKGDSQSWGAFRNQFKATTKMEIPEGLRRMMNLAQEIFQEDFWGSLGEKYIWKERHINPDLAFSRGAGFCTEKVITGLLDSGYSFRELVDAGFIGQSIRLNKRNDLFDLLAKRGMSNDRILQSFDAGKGQTGILRPYLSMKGYLTFPLKTASGIINNFYGRNTELNGSKSFAHRKLSVRVNGCSVFHGMFNSQVLNSGFKEVVAVEAVICALTLIEMGIESTVAVIGVDNRFIIEELVRSGKNIGLGLDVDNTGAQGTLSVFPQKLVDAGFNFSLRDFTADFIREFGASSVGNWKDFNDWWKNSDRYRFRGIFKNRSF
ncbi:MAG: hypothetical protein PHC85_00055 [Candidatus Pacebacteria bacterium]|nr:hypothetical protein [Candidatus Paceibacterota bacterium]